MKLDHEDIRERLPEYSRCTVLPDEVASHLKECTECRKEIALLQELSGTEVPEPGGLFFETLPQRVRLSLQVKKKNFFYRVAPVFAMLVLAVTAGYVYFMVQSPVQLEELYAFSDPFAPQIYDLSDLSEDDIPSIPDTSEGEELYASETTPFFRDFSSLSSEEMEALYEALSIEQTNGGV
jgi:hypothetical protein